MASALTSGATASNSLSQAPGSRTTARQTRTNPSRVSKTAARSFPYYGSQHGQSSANDGAASQGTANNVPHGLFPALTHFTDAITALPREFRRHNSLLKEVDAKAWALEDNLHQLLLSASDSRPVPFPQNPAPIVDGEVREYAHNLNDPQNVESQESKQRRLLFDRIRRTLSDLMLTADEKNHVLTNANEELDHQLYRLDAVHPYIFNEVSEEARLGSLTHWAYSNRAAAKAAAKTTTERPRREAATTTSHLVQALHEADVAAHRSEARRDATVRKPRRNQVDSDFDETRPTQRKGAAAKARAAGGDGADASAPVPKRRRVVDKPAAVQTGSAAMERSTSTVTNNGRTASKDSAGTEVKKRARAPNAVTTAGRKRNNTVTSAVDSPSAPSPPVIGTFNPPRSAPSPGPRPQSSRAQQATTQATSRQRPPSASSRANHGSSTFPLSGDVPLGSNSNSATVDKPLDSKANVSTEDSANEKTPQLIHGDTVKKDALETKSTPSIDKEDRPEVKPLEAVNAAVQMSPALSTIGVTKGRTSKTSTPVVSTFAESQTRARSSRNNNNNTNNETAAPTTKRNTHKKSNSTVSAAYKAKIAQQEEEEESSREGDDEDDESEPRYCYCNQVSFGEMVACDNDACPTEWFHLSCVGLAKPPGRNVKWYCTECKERMKRGRVSAR